MLKLQHSGHLIKRADTLAKTLKMGKIEEVTFSNYGAGEDSRVPWTASRPNPSMIKGINPEYFLEGLMLKLQFFGYPSQRANSLEKALMLGKIEGRSLKG